MVLQSHYKNPECPLTLRKDRLDTRLFTSNPHAMELLRYQGLQLPLAGRKGECSDHVNLAILLPSYQPGGGELPQCLFIVNYSTCSNINVTPTDCKVTNCELTIVIYCRVFAKFTTTLRVVMLNSHD